MIRRSLIAALAVLALSHPALAADPDHPRVSIVTTKGTIVVELEAKKAPVTVKNFLHYVDTQKFDNTVFYRALRYTPEQGLVQAGGGERPYSPIAHESTKKTGLSNVDGTISMARYAPGTASEDFFICVGDMTFLDAGKDPSGDNLGFAAFGHVVSGMDVVRSILAGKTVQHKKGDDNMKGQMLAAPVKIVSARRVP
ncbi:peptidylprolyl isomerase [Asticcacaulis solisilvae]|uniref:peptidylprolyl isomerase n=1 Tax=Asticcacaulis solisilvae TaxID=1217274 RepID=UPI003FD8797E